MGLGKRTSVLDLIKTFMNVNNCKIKLNWQDRRSGDLPICYADNKKNHYSSELETQHDISDMCKDVYTFLKKKLHMINIKLKNLSNNNESTLSILLFLLIFFLLIFLILTK